MKLYARLILWFVLANAVAIGATYFITSQLRQRPYTGDDATRDGQAAVQVYESQGAAGLRRWLRHRRADGVFGMLTDEDGRPLTRGFMPGRGHFGPLPRPDEDEPPERDLPPADESPPQPQRVTIASASGRQYQWIAVTGPPHGRRAHRREVLVYLITGLVAIVGVALLAARSIGAPIRDLKSTTLQLAEGKLQTRVPSSIAQRGDEAGELGRSFNDMAERLQRLLESQRQLLRDVSHELRSPLARLRIASELARGEPAAEHFDRIEQEAAKLDELIGQVLLVAQLESPASMRTREPVDVTDLARQVCEDAELEARQRNVTIKATLADSCVVSGRADLLQSAIENVVRNAVRYTAEGTAVEVTASSETGRWRLTVSDRGPGVPANQLDAIFKPFHRVSAARDRDSGGYGLGLAIAERAVNAHGGSIAADNRDGGGLRVEIVLPTRQ